jgi:hypothetical protein
LNEFGYREIHEIYFARSRFSLAPNRLSPAPARTSAKSAAGYPAALQGVKVMVWFIGRTEAMSNPEGARRKAMERLRSLADLDDPESLVVPILIDAILMAESYRGARHQITFLPELTRGVDTLLRELNIADKAKEWASR